ncbi:MAG: branched-chain amino acid ABC transporter permease [Nitrososphaerota archaeon]
MRARRQTAYTIIMLSSSFIILLALPYMGISAFMISFLLSVFIWVTLAVSWNILSGYVGYFSFGHTGFFGSGAFASAVTDFFFEIDYFLTIPIAGAVTTAMAAGLGLVTFRLRRLRGELFALTTLVLTSVSSIVVINNWGSGIVMRSVKAFWPFISIPHIFYTLALILCFISIYISVAIYRSRLGLNFFAIRDDEEAAEAIGINTFKSKMIAFCISSLLVGVAGAVFGGWIKYVWPETVFSLNYSLYPILMTILGGMGTWIGPIVGGVILTTIFQIVAGGEAVLNNIILGSLLVVVMIFLPRGLFNLVLSGYRRVRSPRHL